MFQQFYLARSLKCHTLRRVKRHHPVYTSRCLHEERHRGAWIVCRYTNTHRMFARDRERVPARSRERKNEKKKNGVSRVESAVAGCEFSPPSILCRPSPAAPLQPSRFNHPTSLRRVDIFPPLTSPYPSTAQSRVVAIVLPSIPSSIFFFPL